MRHRPDSGPARILAIIAVFLSGCRTTPPESATFAIQAERAAPVALVPPMPATVAPAAAPAVVARSAASEERPAGTTLAGPTGARLVYPAARRGDEVDDWHGVKVADPYRWLEDSDSPETRTWIDGENAVTQAYLSRVARRDAIKDRLTELWDFERYGMPYREGGRYILSKNDGLQNQNVLYVADAIDGAPRVLIDPNTLSPDGTVALAGTTVSKDGKLLAYGIADAGSDWVSWGVRDVATGKDAPDRIEWAKFGRVSWTADGAGFFYSRYDAPKPGEKLTGSNRFHKLHYHRLGTPQSADPLIYDRPDDGELNVGGSVTDDGNWLVVTVRKGTQRKNVVALAELSRGRPEALPAVRELIPGFDASYSLSGNHGTTFWFRTDLDAPRGRVIAIDVTNPAKSGRRTVVPEAPETLTGANHVGGHLVLTYLKDARSVVKVYKPDGTFVRDVKLPGLGTAAGFDGEADNPETFYSFTSFTDPGTIYRYDVTTGASTVFRRPKVKFDPAHFETTQVFYPSKDGTKVPMFLTHKRGLRPDGNAPVLLYGYGGFNISITPSFSVSNIVWMEMGGVYAVANLRGGGEYGESWHKAGMKLEKQNVFDDFIAAAEWLIANRWTRREKLATFGGSNGGLLVAATMIQRPDLFGACMPAVGVLDMLRFNKFTVGWGWVPEYGAPENPEEFKALYAYSPYHNLAPKEYPATFITTADHDDRVVPAHSFKFAAALQHEQAGPEPILIRIETRAGHGAGKPTRKQIEEAADRFAFLTKELEMASQ